MQSLTTLITFSYPSEAYVLMSLLESEGIVCFLKDELNVQMYSLNSNAYGGVKLQVMISDMDRAREILMQKGYIEPVVNDFPVFWTKFDKFTSRIMFLKGMAVGYRFLIIAALIIFIMTLLLLQVSPFFY